MRILREVVQSVFALIALESDSHMTKTWLHERRASEREVFEGVAWRWPVSR